MSNDIRNAVNAEVAKYKLTGNPSTLKLKQFGVYLHILRPHDDHTGVFIEYDYGREESKIIAEAAGAIVCGFGFCVDYFEYE